MAENSTSNNSGRYLTEIKAIYERLRGEYDYLKRKQAGNCDESGKVADDGGLRARNYDSLPDVESLNISATKGMAEASCIEDVAVASSVEEMFKNENDLLRERIHLMDMEIVAKNKEWKRIRANFEQLQEVNEKLKQQLNETAVEKKKLETNYKKLQSRFSNLQSCRQSGNDKKSCSQQVNNDKTKSGLASTSTISVTAKACESGQHEKLLNMALEALAEVSSVSPMLSSSTNGVAKTNLIFALAELLKNLPSSIANQQKIVESLLRLFYDALPTSTTGSDEMTELRPGISLSLQKCGETLFNGGKSTNASSFFRGQNLSVRFLSALIILRTVTRADILALALDSILRDCHSEAGREAFLRFDASRTIVPFLRPHNKAFFGSSLAIIAILVSSSQLLLNNFAEIFLNERYVCALSMLLESPNMALVDFEKLSTILLKLANCNRRQGQRNTNTAHRLFNAFGITDTISKMLKSTNNQSLISQSPLVCSNFRHLISILGPNQTYHTQNSGISSAVAQQPSSLAGDTSIGDDISMGCLE